MDDSGDERDPRHADLFCSLMGLVGTHEAMAEFELAWNVALAAHGIPYLHMKEIGRCNRTPYEIWQDRPEAKEACLRELIALIAGSSLACCGAVVRVPDLARFNRENELHITVYGMCIYAAVVEIGQRFKDQDVELFLDRVEKPHKKINEAMEYISTDSFYPGMQDRVRVQPISRGKSARDYPALQAADLVAWEMRRSFSDRADWFTHHKAGDNPREWNRSEREWFLTRNDKHPAARQPMNELYLSVPLHGILWDYRALQSMDQGRGGVWPR